MSTSFHCQDEKELLNCSIARHCREHHKTGRRSGIGGDDLPLNSKVSLDCSVSSSYLAVDREGREKSCSLTGWNVMTDL